MAGFQLVVSEMRDKTLLEGFGAGSGAGIQTKE